MSPQEREPLTAVPPWPVVHLALDDEGRASVDGRVLEVLDDAEPQAVLLAEATRRAADLGRALRVRATDPAGAWYLVAYPDGEVVELPDELVVTSDGAQALPHDPDEPESAWHLVIHPDGQITAADDLDLPLPDLPPDVPSEPMDVAAVPDAAPDPEPIPEPDAPAEPDHEPELEREPEADVPAEIESAPTLQSDPDPAFDDVNEAFDDITETGSDHRPTQLDVDGWYDLPQPPPLLAPDPDDMVHALRATAEVTPQPPRRRWIPLAVAGALGAVTIGGVAFVVRDPAPSTVTLKSASTAGPGASAGTASASPSGASSSAAAAATPTTAPKTLANPPTALDIGAPPGFSAKPLWVLPVGGSSAATVSAEGLLVARSADRRIMLVDPGMGEVRWHAAVPDDASGPYLSRIDGKRVVALLTPDRLVYWPLSDQGLPGDASVTVSLPSGNAVTFAGPSPLVTLGDGTAGVVRGTAVQRVNLPTGMRPLAADGADVLAVTGRNWIRQTAGQPPGTPQELPIPQGVSDRSPIRVENVGGSFLGAMWSGGSGPIVAVYDARTGTKLVQATFPKGVDFATAAAIREVGSERTIVGNALFEPAQRNLSILASNFTPVALAPGHVFANDVSGAVADLQIHGKDLTPVRFPAHNPAVPVGLATAGSRSVALVVVSDRSGWLLAALPRA